jgi:hypothetical protein
MLSEFETETFDFRMQSTEAFIFTSSFESAVQRLLADFVYHCV